jgi:hypothetical protein
VTLLLQSRGRGPARSGGGSGRGPAPRLADGEREPVPLRRRPSRLPARVLSSGAPVSAAPWTPRRSTAGSTPGATAARPRQVPSCRRGGRLEPCSGAQTFLAPASRRGSLPRDLGAGPFPDRPGDPLHRTTDVLGRPHGGVVAVPGKDPDRSPVEGGPHRPGPGPRTGRRIGADWPSPLPDGRSRVPFRSHFMEDV